MSRGIKRINEVPEATRLLNAARAVAIAEFNGQQPTPQVLRNFAACVRDAVLSQVDDGAWRIFGVLDRSGLETLIVRADVEHSLTGSKRIAISYDFSRTRIPHMLARSGAPPVRA